MPLLRIGRCVAVALAVAGVAVSIVTTPQAETAQTVRTDRAGVAWPSEALYGPLSAPEAEPPPDTSPPPETAPPATVAPVSEPSPPAPAPVQAREAWPPSLQPCDGDYPPCYVANRESHGDYNAVNPSGYYGKWQFSQSTWNNVARSVGRDDLVGVRPDQAPPTDQDFLAMVLWDGGRGASHWGA